MMTQEPTADEILAMLREENLVELPGNFSTDGDLFSAGMDSMAVMQLIVIIEERYGAVVGPADAGRENLSTAEALAALIRRTVPA